MARLRDAVNKLLGEELPAVVEQNETGRGRTSDMSEVSQTGGNSRSYTIARLKRDRPDLAEKVIKGELPANAAVTQGENSRVC